MCHRMDNEKLFKFYWRQSLAFEHCRSSSTTEDRFPNMVLMTCLHHLQCKSYTYTLQLYLYWKFLENDTTDWLIAGGPPHGRAEMLKLERTVHICLQRGALVVQGKATETTAKNCNHGNWDLDWWGLLYQFVNTIALSYNCIADLQTVMSCN